MIKKQNTLKRIRAILLVILYIVIYYAVTLLTQLFYVLWQKGSGRFVLSEIEQNLTNGTYALSVISTIITLWIYLIIGKFRKKRIGNIVQNKTVAPMVNIMAVSLAVGLRLVVNVYYAFSQNVELLKKSIDDAAQITPDFTGPAELLICVFAVVVVAPFFEEVLFRGMVFGELKRVMRPWAANILQALLFGVSHLVLFQSLFAFVVGIILGIVYHKTQSIKTAVLCHSAFNLSVILSIGEAGMVQGVVICVLGIILSACSLLYILSNNQRK